MNDAYYQINKTLYLFANYNTIIFTNIIWINNTYTIQILTDNTNFTEQFITSSAYLNLTNLLNPFYQVNHNQNLSIRPQQPLDLNLIIGSTLAVTIFSGLLFSLYFYLYRKKTKLPKNALHIATVQINNPLIIKSQHETEEKPQPIIPTLETIRENNKNIMVDNIMHKQLDIKNHKDLQLEHHRKSIIAFNPVQVHQQSGIDEYNIYSTKTSAPKTNIFYQPAPPPNSKFHPPLRSDFNPLPIRRTQPPTSIQTRNINELPPILRRLSAEKSTPRLTKSHTAPIDRRVL
jgi:hypothetical protein